MTSLCGICRRSTTLFSELLSCGHKAHRKCFKETMHGKAHRCRVCDGSFLSAKDKKILGAKDAKTLAKTFTKYGQTSNASAIYIKSKNPTVKKFIVDSGYNMEVALKEEIEDGNVKGVEFLLASSNINFHATFNRKTLLEIAIGLGVESIIHAIETRMGIKKLR